MKLIGNYLLGGVILLPAITGIFLITVGYLLWVIFIAFTSALIEYLLGL